MPTTFTSADIRKKIKEAGSDINSLAFELAYLASFNIPVRLSDTYIFIRNIKFKIPEEINVATLCRHVITYGCTLIKFSDKAELLNIFYKHNLSSDGKIMNHPEKGKRHTISLH